MDEILNREIALACTPEKAFRAFTEHIDLWWPRAHRRDAQADIVFEPFLGGRLYEKSRDGREWILGEVIAYEPPLFLAYRWFPGSPGAPTAVEIRFDEEVTGAVVRIAHRPVDAQSRAAWPDRVARFEKGWDTVLPGFAEFVARHLRSEG